MNLNSKEIESIKIFFNAFDSIKEYLEKNSFEDFLKNTNSILKERNQIEKGIETKADFDNLNVGQIMLLKNSFEILNKRQATE